MIPAGRDAQGSLNPTPGSPKNHPKNRLCVWECCLGVLSNCILNSSWLGAMTTALGSLFQHLTTLMVKNIFLIFILSHSLASSQEISTCPSAPLQEEAVDYNEVYPQSSFLQTEKTKWYQLLFIHVFSSRPFTIF